MAEGESYNPESEKNSVSPEFDKLSYPDQVGCKALPSLDNQTVSAELEDVWGDVNTIEGIPTQAAKRLNMPRLGPQIFNEVHEFIEQGIGIALLSRRQEAVEGESPDDLEAPVKVWVPTTSGDIEMMVRRKQISRNWKG